MENYMRLPFREFILEILPGYIKNINTHYDNLSAYKAFFETLEDYKQTRSSVIQRNVLLDLQRALKTNNIASIRIEAGNNLISYLNLGSTTEEAINMWIKYFPKISKRINSQPVGEPLQENDINSIIELLDYTGMALLNDIQFYKEMRQKINDPNIDDIQDNLMNHLKEKVRLAELLKALIKEN